MNDKIINQLNKFGVSVDSATKYLESINPNNSPIETTISNLLDLIDKGAACKCEEMFSVYNATLDNLLAGVAIIDGEDVVFLNKTFCRMLNIEKKENITFSFLKSLTHAEDLPKLEEYLLRVQDDVIFDSPIKLRSQANKITSWLEMSASKLFYNGKVCLQINIEDISERVQATLNKEIICDMMAEAEKKKFETEKMIEHSAKIASIGVIASGITHEINQPLNAIKIGSDGMMIWDMQNPGIFPEKIKKVINAIALSAAKIDNIVKHLRNYWLDFSEDKYIPSNPNKIINSAIDLLGQKLKSHDVELLVDMGDPMPLTLADPSEFELIFNNLIINAINHFDKYPTRHDKFIKIKTRADDKYINIEFTDNGTDLSGVPEDMMFQPFIYSDYKNSNYGIELAIVKMFMNSQKAYITASTNQNGGATFNMKFKIYTK
jgi:PAS domain S-box-containing protein